MFGKMMNNYYYGKSGKGDYRKEDLPKNRWQLFWEVLRTRLASLCRLNLIAIAAWIPLFLVLVFSMSMVVEGLNNTAIYKDYLDLGTLPENVPEEMVTRMDAAVVETFQGMKGSDAAATTEEKKEVADTALATYTLGILERMLLYLIPCIFITGPVKAGLAYVTRNWARDEHAFVWSDFKDAMKANWKQALGVSFITSLMPIIMWEAYRFYGQQSSQNVIFVVPQMLVILVGAIWALACLFFYPLMVTYEMKFSQLLKNGVLLAIARLPQTVGLRLLLLVPALLCAGAAMLTFSPITVMVLGGYYFIIGFAMSRFIGASYTNAVFDKFINSRMEGVQVNRGLASPEEEDDDEAEEENDPQ